MNITAPIRRIARLQPDAPAIVGADDTAISYGRLDRLIDGMARRAAALGLQPGDVAGLDIAGPDQSISLALAMGLARMGVTGAAMSLPAPHRRLSFGTEAGVPLDASWLSADAGIDRGELPINPDPHAIARIFASSGTTGAPKHIPVSHALWEHRMTAYTLGLDPAPLIRIITVSFGITWGFTAVMRTLWAGGTIVLTSPAQLMEAIRRHKVESLVVSPSSLGSIVASLPSGERPPSLRCIEVSGAPLPPNLHAAAVARLCENVVIFMGSSETGGTASGTMGAPFMTRLGSAGVLLPGVEMEALGEDGGVLPPGEEGALRVRSSSVAPGYVDEPAGPSPFRDGWFYTGDSGAVWAGGVLTLAGRTTDIINSGGVKVSPLVVEAVLHRFPTVLEAIAFGVPDRLGVIQVWAAVVAPGLLDTAALGAFCTKELGATRPRAILQVPAIPRNANGKVRRDLLIQHALEQQAKADQVKPR